MSIIEAVKTSARRHYEKELELLENDLVPVYTTDTGEKVVYGTELFLALGSKRQYTDWISERLKDCDAVENEDYQSFSQKNEKGGRPKTEYIIKLDIAKEMAMLERNEKGKQVRRYFIEVEKRYKKGKEAKTDASRISDAMYVVRFIADDLRCNDASRLLMYETMCKDLSIPTNFLPKYEHNGNHDMKALSTLLKENGYPISAVKFNQILVEHGYLEERERKSSNGNTKKYKALTDKGLAYGENAVNPHNQKEVQPLYYSDKISELYELVMN